MPVRSARDVPEARSRLLRFLDESAAEAWTVSLDKTGYHLITGVRQHDGHPSVEVSAIPGKDGAPSGAAVPIQFEGETINKTAGFLARWQRHAIANSALYFVNEDITRAAMHAATSVPAFEFHDDVLPADRGLLCWAWAIASGENVNQLQTQVSAVSWCPLADGLYVTFYVDTSAAFRTMPAEYRPEALRIFGWLTETGTLMIPWGGTTEPHRYTNPTLHRAFITMLTTWLFMGQTITSSSPVEPDKKTRRKIAHRGHPTDAVRLISLRRTVNTGVNGEPAGTRTYRHQWMVGGHWRNQWYAGKRVHRPTYIHPYLKGPEGAPLLHAEKVYTLTR